jgi:hypothetical protein
LYSQIVKKKDTNQRQTYHKIAHQVSISIWQNIIAKHSKNSQEFEKKQTNHKRYHILFINFLTCKTFTKISRNTLKTHKNFLGIFIKDFKVKRGVISKSSIQNSKKTSEERKSARNRPRPKILDGSGLSKRIRSVGLIQLHQTLDLVVKKRSRVEPRLNRSGSEAYIIAKGPVQLTSHFPLSL